MSKKTFSSKLNIEDEIKVAQTKAKKIVEENYNDVPTKWYEKIVFSWVYLLFLFAAIIFFIGLFFLPLRKFLWKKRVRRVMPLDQAMAYKEILEPTYNNVKVSNACDSTIPREIIEKYRGESVPKEAWIIRVVPSPVITIDKSNITMNKVTWKWRSGNQTITAYRRYMYVSPISKSLNDLSFSLAKRKKISINKGKDMDSTYFNRAYSFKHDNAIKFRMLFTVATQEKYVALSKTKLGKTLKIAKTPDFLIMSHTSIGSPFEPNAKRVTFNTNKLKQEISDDFTNDIEAVFKTIAPIANLKGIFNSKNNS